MEAGHSIPATFLIPQGAIEPVEIVFKHDSLQMAIVDKAQIDALGTKWDVCGVYVLFGGGSQIGGYEAYVGKAPSGLRSRLKEHVKGREGWDRAVLVARPAGSTFDSADVGWLEGRVFEMLARSPHAEVLNRVRPRDESLKAWDRDALDRLLVPLAGIFRVLGYRPDPPTSEDEGAAFVTAAAQKRSWDNLHRILRAIPAGRWTSYGELAAAVESHPRPVGTHLQSCDECVNAHRVLNRFGQIAPGFAWTDPGDTRDPAEILRSEGLPLGEDGRADRDSQLMAGDLLALTGTF